MLCFCKLFGLWRIDAFGDKTKIFEAYRLPDLKIFSLTLSRKNALGESVFDTIAFWHYDKVKLNCA